MLRLYDHYDVQTAKAYARRGGEALFVEYTIASEQAGDLVPHSGTLYDRDKTRLVKLLAALSKENQSVLFQDGVLWSAFLQGAALERMIKEANHEQSA